MIGISCLLTPAAGVSSSGVGESSLRLAPAGRWDRSAESPPEHSMSRLRQRRSAHGLFVLFTSSVGTGKTFATCHTPPPLRARLLRIDRAMVTTDHIGETERKAPTDYVSWIDSSSGSASSTSRTRCCRKTSEVGDAHDRYTNIEVAYPLQRFEDCEGLAILSNSES